MQGSLLAIEIETDLVALRSEELDAGAAPARVLIAPWGEVESTRGNFVVDAEALAATIEQFREHATDLPIDFEHQTLGGAFSSPDGLAPAAGWIKDLISVESVGLMAEVEWTELGLEHLQLRQYRYLSPVAMVRQSDRRMTGLHSAALTNKPAIVGMEAIVNRDAACGGDDGTAVSESAQAVFDPEAQTRREARTRREACGSLSCVCGTHVRESARAKARGSLNNVVEDQSMLESLETLRKHLQLNGEEGARQVLIAAAQRITELEQHQELKNAEERVVEALACGKLTEAQREWAMRLALKDPASFEQWSRSAPVVICLGQTAGPGARDRAGNREHGVASRARSEYQSDSLLQALTSEEAYVQLALREE